MATITTRSGKGSALTFTEMDANFTNLNTDKLELSGGTLTGNLVMAAGKTVTIGNDYTFPTADGTANQFLQTDGNGNLSFVTGAGGGIALTDLSVGAEGTAAGDGSLAYNNTTGVFTYTPPVLSGLTGDTDDISEGTTNLYYTDARADARVNLQTGANLDLSSKSTTDLAEGTNLYYTDERVDDRVNGLLVAGTNITLTYDDVANTLTIASTDTGLLNVVEDTTPQLGGDLDVNGQKLVTTSNGNIILEPNGTGEIRIDSNIIEQYSAEGMIIHNFTQGNNPDLGAGPGTVFGNGLDVQSNGSYTGLNLWSHKSNSGYPNLWAHRNRDDGAGNKDFLNSGDRVFNFLGSGWDGSADTPGNYYGAFASVGEFILSASEDHSASARGGKWEFITTTSGGTTKNAKMTIGDHVTMNNLLELQAYASGSLPTGVNGAIISISDNSYKPAYYNGSSWRYVADDSAV